jgi:hypothetical protein
VAKNSVMNDYNPKKGRASTILSDVTASQTATTQKKTLLGG